MHQIDIIRKGVLACWNVKERRLHLCHAQGKITQFQHEGSWRVLQEIQQAEYFDSVLTRLSIQDLEKSQYNLEINTKDCWRHKVFLHGSCEIYTNHSKSQLINFDKFAGFSNDQLSNVL